MQKLWLCGLLLNKKEVEILMTDGSIKRDIMVKGKYGNYEWRNWTDKCVVG